MEENLNKIDDLSRSVDIISHDVENLKMKIFVPKFKESLKLFMFLWMKVRKEPLCLELEEKFYKKRFLVITFIKVMKILK